MSLTEKESNFLRFYFLNLKVASKAVREYFDSIYPRVKLAGELKIREIHLKSLSFLTSPQKNILFPSSGQYGTSEKFDTTLMICLLRNMHPYQVANPPDKGWDNFPKATDTSHLADLARVKWYRNFVSHHEKGELTVADYNYYCRDLEKAIGRLGGPPMFKQAQTAQHIVLDRSLIDLLNLTRKHEKDIDHLKTSQEKNTRIINDLRTKIENQETIKEQHENRIQKQKSESSKHSSEIAEIKETIETWERTIKEHEEKNEGIQVNVVEIHQQFVDLTRQLFGLEIKYNKKFKEIDDKLVEHTDELVEHKDKLVEHEDKLVELDDQIDNIKKTHFHTGGSNQKRIEEQTQDLIKADLLEGTFVSTKAVTDGLLMLQLHGVLLITGQAGTGKSRTGRHVLHMFCSGNKSLKCMNLNLEEWEDMSNKKDYRPDGVVLLFDDIFGETNSFYEREKDTVTPILDKVHACVLIRKTKVIITIRDTVKRQCQKLFEDNRLFHDCYTIDLSSETYILNREEKHTILKKYMKKKFPESQFIKGKGFVDSNDRLMLKTDEVSNITCENPVKGFPLAVYQFVHNNKYFDLGSTFFDRPTEAMLEEMNAIRRKGEEKKKFKIQYAVMVYTAINENCINHTDQSCAAEVTKIIDAIYGETIKVEKWQIVDAVKELKDSYLINIPNQRSYRLHHQTLQESVILSFAQIQEQHINKIIPLISSSFFLKMVKPESYEEKEGEVVLIIPTDSYEILADRLADFYIADRNYICHGFIHCLCKAEIFQREYYRLLHFVLEALEKEDKKDKHTENMIRSGKMDKCESDLIYRKNKDSFLADLLNTLAKLEGQLDIYEFVLDTFKTTTENSSSFFTIDHMNSALISSLYATCSSKNVRNVKATLDIIEEHKIPVLLDQGLILTRIPDYISKFRKDAAIKPCVFLTLCICNAYTECNIPVLEFLLSKYVRNPFDINLFFKMMYGEKMIKNINLTLRRKFLSYQSLCLEPLKWMIEKFQDQKLDDPNFLLRTACKYQMFNTVEYLASEFKTFDEISCLLSFVNKATRNSVPFNKTIFDFLIKRIDITSKDLIPVVKEVIKYQNVPGYMFDALLPVCINIATILTLACENGQFYLVKLIIESSNIEHLDFQSALIAACKEYDNKWFYYHNKEDDEAEKLEIVKYIVNKFEFEKFDLKAACQQSCSSKKFKILEWFIHNIDTTRLDVYTIIDTALVCKRSEILEHILNKTTIDNLDKREVLKSVTEPYTAGCATTILKIVRTIWDSTEDKEVLHMAEIVNEAYERKSFELLMWIHDNCHPHVSIDSKKVFMLACEDYRVDVAKRVLQTLKTTTSDIDGGKIFIKLSTKTYFKEMSPKMRGMVNWILDNCQMKRTDIVSGALGLIETKNDLSDLVVSILEKYSSFLEPEDMNEMINRALGQKKYFLVNWFLKTRSSCCFDKQMILNKACTDGALETIKTLSEYFSTLDLKQAMINACNLTSSLYDAFTFEQQDFNNDQSVACFSLLWDEINKKDHDSIDIGTIVSTVCKEKAIRNSIMTWILLNFLDQIPINEVLIACIQQSKIHHVKYIVHKVDNEKLDIKEAFVEACRAFPGAFNMLKFQLQKDEHKWDVLQKKMNEPQYLMIVDFLFQKTTEIKSYLNIDLNEMLEKEKFHLMLYFLQAGYCKKINMNDLFKKACMHGEDKLVQWIVANIEHKELDIKSAFHEACEGIKHNYVPVFEEPENHFMCVALMWHYIPDIHMFQIDTVLNKMTELQSKTSDSDADNRLKTWLLYIKNINPGIC